jgi:hypothetical protein
MTYEGKRVFIWNWPLSEGGDALRIAAKCREHGVRGVVIKSADGGHPFGPFWDEDRGKRIVADLLGRGIDVWLWQFVYGQVRVFYGDQKLGWEAEADQGIRALNVFGATGYMSDVEGEFESLGDQAAGVADAYCRRIREGAPDRPHYWCPLAQPSYHRADVYQAFHRHVIAAFPQDYHGSMYPVGTPYYRPDRAEHAARVCAEDFRRSTFPQVPLVPSGDAIPASMNAAHAVTAEEILVWSRTWKELGARGALWWVWEYMTEEMWQAVQAARFLEADEMWTRHNRVAAWFTNRVLEPGPYGPDKDATWQLRSDFDLPGEARSVELEICLGLAGRNTQAFVAFFDGGTPDGSNEGYAGKVTLAEGGHGTVTVQLDARGTCRVRYSYPVLVKSVVSLRWWP